jgi:rieske iron-sulfur protein
MSQQKLLDNSRCICIRLGSLAGTQMTKDCDQFGVQLCRRQAMLGVALALSPWLKLPARADDQPDETEKRPQPGDHFVFLTGPKKGQPARAEDLELGGPQLQTYPADPKGVVRDGSPLNLVLLVRVGSDGVNAETRARSADGVVAYSAICTHQACPVTMWSKDKNAMVCSCHGSTFVPKDGAEVIFGPAPMPLAALPLKSDSGLLIVAGGFVGALGRQTN